MGNYKDWQKIRIAQEAGLVRAEGVKAEPNQILTYILSDKKFYHHATLESAKAEKEFLQAALQRDLKIYKVWNSKREMIDSDMRKLRHELSGISEWNDTQAAIDRILVGAGY